jgi:hypothetical protein
VLQSFFDDSGQSHCGDTVVVWGGVIGSSAEIADLEQRWRALLASPLPGKPPLGRFHLAECRARRGPFDNYSKAEVDRVQWLFRQVIIDAGLVAFACGVDVAAWNSFVVGGLRNKLMGPERLAFGDCIKSMLEVAEDNDTDVVVVYDEGAMNTNLLRIIDAAADNVLGTRMRVTTRGESVANCPSLQAADVVSNSMFRYAQAWIGDHDAKPDPHFESLLTNIAQHHLLMFGEDSIKRMVFGILSEPDSELHFGPRAACGEIGRALDVLDRLDREADGR